ncbi:Oligoribonuclease, mitochondrial [Smittium culicis]|uniref:Oligoribonuclease, mitochondrial n=1 Tax=Smittium culicis TaxID=133412 RepID=A0A1R1YL12_9FUNG|nr:Oligoribonuclease, mitochondrial [Smittium culicis]
MSSSSSMQAATNTAKKSPEYKNYPLFWIDIETTGLDIETSKILELSLIVTDENLDIIDQGLDLVFSQPASVLDGMDDWCRRTHASSGLIDRVNASQITLEQGEQLLLDKIMTHCPRPRKAIFAGNSVHFDQLFIFKHMPSVQAHMHFRIIDVSSINELGKRWAPQTTRAFGRKALNHRARYDILESINELRYYKNTFFSQNIN